MIFLDLPPFPGLVTEDGAKLLLDHPVDFKQHYRQFAGQAVEVYIRAAKRAPSDAQRGYLWGVLVRLYAEYVGEENLHAAHFQLKRLLLTTPSENETPTTSNSGDHEITSDLIFRAQVYLTLQGVIVPDAEPDPVKRFEMRMQKGRVA